MSTTTTANLWRLLRTHLLGFTPPTGGTLASRGVALYYDQAPDAAAYPYAVGRFINRQTGGAYNGDREELDLELQWFHRPRVEAETLEDIVDVADMALLRYADASGGLVFSRERFRDTQAPRPAPADREVVQIWTRIPCVVWPEYLTQFSPFVTS